MISVPGNTVRKSKGLTNIKVRVMVPEGKQGNMFGKLQRYLTTVVGTWEFILLLYLQ